MDGGTRANPEHLRASGVVTREEKLATPSAQRLVQLIRESGENGPSVHALGEAHRILERLRGIGIVPISVSAGERRSVVVVYEQRGEWIVSIATRSGERIDVALPVTP